MLSKEALDEFKKIWREEKGTDIPNDLAVEEAINLLTFYNVVYRPIKKEWFEEYEKTHPADQTKGQMPAATQSHQ